MGNRRAGRRFPLGVERVEAGRATAGRRLYRKTTRRLIFTDLYDDTELKSYTSTIASRAQTSTSKLHWSPRFHISSKTRIPSAQLISVTNAVRNVSRSINGTKLAGPHLQRITPLHSYDTGHQTHTSNESYRLPLHHYLQPVALRLLTCPNDWADHVAPKT